MGYTHYWRILDQLPEKSFISFFEDAEAIFDTSEIGVEVVSTGTHKIKESFSFNGVGDDSYETAYFSKSMGFEFCKTAYYPYDEIVCAVLIAAKENFGQSIEISSDGGWEAWLDGRELYRRTFPDRNFSSPLK